MPYAPPESLVKIQQQYFEQLDQIIAVSEDVTNSISAYYPEFSQKVFTIKDPISQKFSEERASDFQPDWIEENIPHLVTAARLVQQQKGMDILLETATNSERKRVKIFRWFVAWRRRPTINKWMSTLANTTFRTTYSYLEQYANP